MLWYIASGCCESVGVMCVVIVLVWTICLCGEEVVVGVFPNERGVVVVIEFVVGVMSEHACGCIVYITYRVDVGLSVLRKRS